MTMAEAGRQFQMALQRKRALQQRCSMLFFGDIEEIPELRAENLRALREAEAEVERCKRGFFEAAREM